MPMKPIETRLGDRIRLLRESKGWLQRELAKAAGVPLRTIGRIERGEVDVRLSTLARIAHGLGVTLTDLLQ
jgi:transcriptional regulator with XRE-family HTH domain